MNKSEIRKKLITIGKGSIIAIFITLFLLFIFSIILTYSNIQEKTITPIIIIISAFSVLIGSSIAMIKTKKSGIFNGMLIGIIYIFTIYVLSSIIEKNFSLNINSFIMMIISIIAGMIGGIIGVNI